MTERRKRTTIVHQHRQSVLEGGPILAPELSHRTCTRWRIPLQLCSLPCVEWLDKGVAIVVKWVAHVHDVLFIQRIQKWQMAAGHFVMNRCIETCG